MDTAAADVVGVIESIYAVERPTETWLRGVVEVARPFVDQGLGVVGYFVDISGADRVRGWGFVDPTGLVDHASNFAAWQDVTPLWLQRAIHRAFPCGFSGELPLESFGEAGELVRSAAGSVNAFGVNGLDASGRGCVLVGWVPPGAAPRTRPDPALWGRMAAHLATGARLLARSANASPGPDAAEAVISPTGAVADASGSATTRIALAALREMAVRVERARGRERRDAQEATRLWQAMVAGRWSLIDHFERGGRRYLLAIPNEVEVAPSVLSRREEQAVGYAALGHDDKLIAYEMGLQPSTVAGLLSRAAKKLGAGSRVELIRRHLARLRDVPESAK